MRKHKDSQASIPVVRERHHNFDIAIPRYFDSGNVVLTAERSAQQLLIPPGECYFIRSVQRLAPRAKDPYLQLQIKAFLGQEGMHSKETNRFLEILKRQGIPAENFCAKFETWIRRMERIFPAKVHLAVTAAAEHYTAVFAIWSIGTRYGEDHVPPVLADLWQWHGAEELEHKSVAFDLLQAVSPKNYPLRALGFFAGIGLMYIWYRKALRMLLKHEGLTRSEIWEERRKARKIRMPIFFLRFPHLFTYLRPGFHPNDLDDGHLSKHILAEQAARADG
jgi:uncharacterized protein